jgi:hypothetical protein
MGLALCAMGICRAWIFYFQLGKLADWEIFLPLMSKNSFFQ